MTVINTQWLYMYELFISATCGSVKFCELARALRIVSKPQAMRPVQKSFLAPPSENHTSNNAPVAELGCLEEQKFFLSTQTVQHQKILLLELLSNTCKWKLERRNIVLYVAGLQSFRFLRLKGLACSNSTGPPVHRPAPYTHPSPLRFILSFALYCWFLYNTGFVSLNIEC